MFAQESQCIYTYMLRFATCRSKPLCAEPGTPRLAVCISKHSITTRASNHPHPQGDELRIEWVGSNLKYPMPPDGCCGLHALRAGRSDVGLKDFLDVPRLLIGKCELYAEFMYFNGNTGQRLAMPGTPKS